MAGLGDIRNVGSGNIGATNVLRTGRKGLAAATLVGDALKGTAAVLLARYWSTTSARWRHSVRLSAISSRSGSGFEAARASATFLGVLLGLQPLAALAFALIWLGVAWLTRYSSLSALVASAATPRPVASRGAAASPASRSFSRRFCGGSTATTSSGCSQAPRADRTKG